MRRASLWGGLVLVVAALLIAPAALAQNPTGNLTGTVSGPDGAALPGVTVTATSPNLQGSRVGVTGPNGTYRIGPLPPGDYQVSYELDGFATLTREVKISAAVNTASDVSMQLATVAEEIVVTGQQAAISESGTGSATYTHDEVEALPIQRDLDSVVLLTPGAGNNEVTGGVSIAGAMSFENLWTLNGVVINENVRGQELPLFIEDAIQETTTQVSGISAEYGRFQGGVINAITKSGGNEFSGSFRVNLTNDDWQASTELSADPVDDINQSYEATLGGYVWKDHLWFFGAGRDESLSENDSLPLQNIPVAQTEDETRYEAKLTGNIADSHTIVGSYLEINREQTNTWSFTAIDRGSLTDREDPQEISAINYTGILTPSFFVEAQYSEREYQIGKGSGANSRTLIDGTLMRTRQGAFRYYTPTFCGVCEQEERNNENWLAKGSWFLSSESIGTHDVVFGYDTFSDIRFSVNHQTGSDFTVWDSDFHIMNEEVFPIIYPCVFSPDPTDGCTTTSNQNPGGRPAAWIGWWAVFNLDNVQPTDFETNSLYVNDRWQLNENWSFNLGARYDETSGTNGGGAEVLNDDKISPRLGVTWDVKGDGDFVAHANYGTYVAAPTNTIADSTSSGGAIGLFNSQYGGPALNTGCGTGGPCMSTREVLIEIFNWYLANGGTDDLNDDISNLPNLISISIPGATSGIQGTLVSPNADEIAIGATKRLGNRGLVRADLVLREYGDFYSNLTAGEVGTATGDADFTRVGNFGDTVLEREYQGLHVQARYRFTDRLSGALNYALSELEGNVVGETGPSGPVTTSPFTYPEYIEPSWAYPSGPLPGDSTHRFRGWVIYDLLDTEHHGLTLSVLQNYETGAPFELSGSINSGEFVPNPGYNTPPSTVTYFFSDRGEFRYDDIYSTDLSLNYSFLWNAFGRQVEVYLQPEVLNVFDHDNLVDFDERIRTAGQANAAGVCPGSSLPDMRCETFNPFTTTPVEGVHWAKRDTFGEPLEEIDYQDPREFRFAVGFRF
jgi:hypothetical protein